ncbi:hypothetical protein ACJRO7_011992 [Eucalyptus globulus]|uniref:Uncharacterized protein n=1 Tax=Eucalyptus globulus TaxID=34317 RepID=A0ABD3LI72_EUCGL
MRELLWNPTRSRASASGRPNGGGSAARAPLLATEQRGEQDPEDVLQDAAASRDQTRGGGGRRVEHEARRGDDAWRPFLTVGGAEVGHCLHSKILESNWATVGARKERQRGRETRRGHGGRSGLEGGEWEYRHGSQYI